MVSSFTQILKRSTKLEINDKNTRKLRTFVFIKMHRIGDRL
jgi:hypothetical protein